MKKNPNMPKTTRGPHGTWFSRKELRLIATHIDDCFFVSRHDDDTGNIYMKLPFIGTWIVGVPSEVYGDPFLIYLRDEKTEKLIFMDAFDDDKRQVVHAAREKISSHDGVKFETKEESERRKSYERSDDVVDAIINIKKNISKGVVGPQ